MTNSQVLIRQICDQSMWKQRSVKAGSLLQETCKIKVQVWVQVRPMIGGVKLHEDLAIEKSMRGRSCEIKLLGNAFVAYYIVGFVWCFVS